MRYTQLYNQIIAAHPRQGAVMEQLNHHGWEELRAAMDRLDTFIPTEYPQINALIAAHSPVIKYDAERTARTVYDTHTKESWLSLPPPQAFVSPDAYARVVVHELSHWVKWHNADILAERENTADYPPPSDDDVLAMIFGQEPQLPYAVEELTAETTAYLIVSKIAPEIPLQLMVDYLRVWGNNLYETGYAGKAIERLYDIAQERAHDAARYLLAPLNLTPED